jgi:hypothetical protein
MQNLLATLPTPRTSSGPHQFFTSAALLTLALGIGGTKANFSLIHAVMLRSLAVSNTALL